MPELIPDSHSKISGAHVPDFNLFSPQFRGNPYPYYKEIRNYSRAHHFEQLGLWAVGGYEDVNHILKSPQHFSSATMASFDPTLWGADPPHHTRVRKMVSPLFSQHRLSQLKSVIREIATDCVNHMITKGESDVIAECATPLPLKVIMKILGADPDRENDFTRWSQSIVDMATGMVQPIELPRIQRDNRDFIEYLKNHMEECLRRPNDSTFSELLGGDGQEGLNFEEAINFSRLLLVAGNETTTNLIGNAIRALLHHPEEINNLRNHPGWIPGVVEEVLRYDAPVQFVQRLVVREIEIFDTRLPAGAMVLALIGSANRDPEHFPNPDQFLINRYPKDHLAFGSGIHFCLGAQLARIQATIVLEELLLKTTTLTSAQDVDQIEWVSMFQLRGPKHLRLFIDNK